MFVPSREIFAYCKFNTLSVKASLGRLKTLVPGRETEGETVKILTLILFVLGLVACSATHQRPLSIEDEIAVGDGMGKEDSGQNIDCVPSDMELVDFQDVNQAIFSTTCTQCHSGSSPAAGINTSNFVGVTENLQRIFDSMESGRMPFAAPPVSNDNINLIAAWMNIGAPEQLEDLTLCE